MSKYTSAAINRLWPTTTYKMNKDYQIALTKKTKTPVDIFDPDLQNENQPINAAEFYYDYLNDFLTIEGIASHYQISEEKAERLINYGRLVWSRKQFAK